MKELVYLDRGGIKVTSAVFLTNTFRYYIKDIKGVIITKKVNYRSYLLFLSLIFLSLAVSFESIFCFVMLGLCIFYMLIFMRTKYILRIKMNIGEISPLLSYNLDELNQIKAAIDESMREVNRY